MAAAWLGFAAQAAWDVLPQVGLTTEVDDNARLLPQDQPSSTRSAVDASLRLRAFGTRGEAYIEPRIVADAYADDRDSELENNDVFLLTRAAYDLRNTTLEFQSDFRSESVLRAELDSALPDDPALGPPPVDIGSGTLLAVTDVRRRLDLGFNVQFGLSERTNLRLETSRIDVGYPDRTSTGLTPFDNNTFAVVLNRLVDQRNTVSATAYASRFHAQRNDNDTDAFGVRGAFSRPLTQTWSLAFNAGVARTDFNFVDANTALRVVNADTSFTFGVSLDKRSALTDWSLSAGRGINPNNNGFLSGRDDVRLQVRHQFRPRLSVSAGARFSQVDTQVSGTGNRKRNYSRESLEIEWEMTQRWLITAGFDRVDEEFLSLNGATATSNSFLVGIRYRGLEQQQSQPTRRFGQQLPSQPLQQGQPVQRQRPPEQPLRP
jgi:hypothetical protein